jgi:hypothetical protein
MTEPRNPLEVVEEALAALEYGERWTEGTTTRKRCPLCASGYPEHQPDCVVPAALALVRKMRVDAVAWLSQVQHEDGSWHAYRRPRWTREQAESDIESMFGVFRIVPLFLLPDSTEASDDD